MQLILVSVSISSNRWKITSEWVILIEPVTPGTVQVSVVWSSAQPGPQVTADRPRRNPAYSDRSRRTVTPITDLSIAQCFNLKNPSKLFIDFPILCLYDTLTFLLSSLEEYNDGKKRSLRRNNDAIASIAERALYARFIKTSFITSNSFLPQLIQFADNDKEKPIPWPNLIIAA